MARNTTTALSKAFAEENDTHRLEIDQTLLSARASYRNSAPTSTLGNGQPSRPTAIGCECRSR